MHKQMKLAQKCKLKAIKTQMLEMKNTIKNKELHSIKVNSKLEKTMKTL